MVAIFRGSKKNKLQSNKSFGKSKEWLAYILVHNRTVNFTSSKVYGKAMYKSVEYRNHVQPYALLSEICQLSILVALRCSH